MRLETISWTSRLTVLIARKGVGPGTRSLREYPIFKWTNPLLTQLSRVSLISAYILVSGFSSNKQLTFVCSHRALSSFFDLRATWTKWVDDILFTQSQMEPAGTVPTIVPCVFNGNRCRNSPHGRGKPPQKDIADVAWGSILPLLGAYSAQLTGDARLARRAAVGSAAYVALLHSKSNDGPASAFPGLLNTTNWPAHLGDWVPATGSSAVSTLLNSHHLILDADAAAALLRWTQQNVTSDKQRLPELDIPSSADLTAWAATARDSFARAFLHNVTVPDTRSPSLCVREPERHEVVLSCGTRGTIQNVTFAGYGLPGGSCAEGGFKPNQTCYLDVRRQVSAACLGRTSCTVECYPDATNHTRVCAGSTVADPCNGVPKSLSVSFVCSSGSSHSPIVGLAFRDPYRPTPARGPPVQTEAASGMAAMERAPATLIDERQRVALGDMLVSLVVNHNSSNPQRATVTGGVIDMAHLAPQLLRSGHPDVAFDLLAAEGYPSYYNMAKYGSFFLPVSRALCHVIKRAAPSCGGDVSC